MAIVTAMAIVTVTLSYNANGGSPKPSSQSANYDPEINAYAPLTVSSTRPSRTGYNFSSWGGYAPGSVIKLTSSKTLKASWSEKSYSVSFNANGGTGAPAAVKKKYFSDLMLPEEIPTYAGKSFVAWNTAADGTGASFAPGSAYTTNEAMELYAQWEPAKYKITYNANGGTGAPASQTKTHGADLFLSAAVPTLNKMGFVAWDTDQQGTGDRYIPGSLYTADADLTLFAVWEEGITVSFNANGGSDAPAPQLKFAHQDLTLSSSIPSRQGYTFVHWNTDPNDAGTNYAPGSTYSVNEELTLYAVWTPVTYQISFIPAQPVKPAVYDSPVGDLPVPSKTGYTFSGWYYSGIQWTTAKIMNIPGNITLEAAWLANKYVLEFDADGGETPEISASVTFDDQIGHLPVATRDGYIFGGWELNGNLISPSTVYTIADDSVAVAKWEPKHYTVTYLPGDGEGTPVTQEIIQDVAWETSEALFHKVGHYQEGWSGIGFEQEMNTWGDMTLTANYKIATYHLTFAGVGTMDVEYGSVIGHLPTLYRPGKHFQGWSVMGQKISYDDRYLWDGPVTASPIYGDLTFGSASAWGFVKSDEPHLGFVIFKKEDGSLAIGKVYVAAEGES